MKSADKSIREMAGDILSKVEAQNAYADILLDQTLRTVPLEERDRALLTELTYGTLRWRGTIDARLTRHLHRPLAQVDAWLRNLLRLSCYQLHYLDRIPDYAAVNEAVELAKSRGGRRAAGFVNGVLRNLLKEPHADIDGSTDNALPSAAVRYSHPEWLARRWLDEFGAVESRALMRANNERSPLILRVNLRRCTRDDLVSLLKSRGIEATATSYSPQGVALPAIGSVDKLPGFSEGFFQVQGEASQLVGCLLSPLPGESILDACAAPGGKSTHIAELMADCGEVIAVDTSARGVERIGQNASRLGLNSVRARRGDASELLGERGARYDRILVDAPCTGLGTLRAHPEIKWRRDESDVRRLSRLQFKILSRVSARLKPGGILVYSTCTLTEDENHGNVHRFLDEHREFELQDAAGYLPHQAQHMMRGKYFQALPHRDNTDGFFAARMRKAR